MLHRPPEELTFDNTYSRFPQAFYAEPNPMPFSSAPYLVSFNPATAALLDLNSEEAARPEFARVFGGSMLAPGMESLAMLYSGHQFGVYVPQLGEARSKAVKSGSNGRRRIAHAITTSPLDGLN